MFYDMSKVPWLNKEEIKTKADRLLLDYGNTKGGEVVPPIPVENIIESHLGYVLEYEDLHEIIGFGDILGATWLTDKRIVINEKLLEENLGRMFFTCGHEIGHVLLHGQYITAAEENPSNSCTRQGILCREVASKKRGEWQADYFSACLLMPEGKVRMAFKRSFGPDPLIIQNKKSCFPRGAFVLDPAWDRVKDIASMVMETGNFTNVSKEAMRFRLEDLGLLIDDTSNQFWT